MKKIICIFCTVYLFSLPSFATQWETFFEVENIDGKAKVEIDKHSIKFRTKSGDKTVSFKARAEWGNKQKTVKTYNYYDANCSTLQATRKEGTIDVYRNNRHDSHVKVTKTELGPKEQIDLQKVIKKICNFY